MSREVEVLQREREDLQQALSEAKRKQPEPQAHTDADYKYLESKLKVCFQILGLQALVVFFLCFANIKCRRYYLKFFRNKFRVFSTIIFAWERTNCGLARKQLCMF